MLKSIKIFALVELGVLASYFYSSTLFINIQVAFLSSFFIILGSALAYKKMVQTQIETGEYEEKKDLLDSIEDPHELYEINDDTKDSSTTSLKEIPEEELDLKAIVKEERAKIKTFSLSSLKQGARGSISLLRLVPYLLLALGFIALKNNDILVLKFYLPSLLLGIILGSLLSKHLR